MRPNGNPYPVPPRDPNTPPPPRRVVIWYHDESVFYAHDRRHRTWYHKNASAKPQQKGEGHSYMVADFFSADFGWLKHPWTGRSARVCMKPGANRGGYFTNVEVRAQAKIAVELVNELWPDIDHVFCMPKSPSGSNPRFPDANLMGQRIKRGDDGKPVYGPDRKVLREPVPMTGAKLPNGADQDLYFPPDHSNAGRFKGMAILLEERGLHDAAKLPAECKNFKCLQPKLWNYQALQLAHIIPELRPTLRIS
ncbi:hypothetical protein MKEN_01114500 [Mycena kentingensis (nom. inval.)]|nr:hypothetical protein MKEN_01114500 [Mycena kentingensis (nom. inval.)]